MGIETQKPTVPEAEMNLEVSRANLETDRELPPQQFEAMIVLAKGWKDYLSRHEGEEKLALSLESKMTALAAAEMLKSAMVKKLIITAGKSAGQDKPSEAAAMREYLLRHFKKEVKEGTINPENIILEEESLDTVETAKNIAALIGKLKIQGALALMSVSHHLPRSLELFEKEGIAARPFPSDEVLKKFRPRYTPLIRKYQNSPYYTLMEAKEFLMRHLLIIDPNARIPGLITGRARHKDQRTPEV